MKLRPIGRYLVVSPELKKGLLWTPDNTCRSGSAEVVAIGNDVDEVAPGDRVYFNPFSGVEMKLQKETLLLLQIDQIFAVHTDRVSLLAPAES